MLQRRQPIDGRRPDRFRPPHCPYPECPEHLARRNTYAANRYGTYRRKCDPHRAIPRFLCRRCRRTFSMRAFSPTFRMKRPELLQPTAGLIVSGSALRQIARFLGCSPITAMRNSVRLGRHMQDFHAMAMAGLDRIEEPVVFDHFETHVRSQVERVAVGTAVGQESSFTYDLRAARYRGALRRAARRPPLKTPPKPTEIGAVARSTQESFEFLLSKSPDGLTLVTDDHPAYPGAFRAATQDTRRGRLSRHISHRNPKRAPGHDKKAARIRHRAMFAVDSMHKMIRHSDSHHRRQTIAFARKTSNLLGRLAVFGVWRNLIKLATERRPCRETPAMRIGLTEDRWTWADVLAERVFPARHKVAA